MEQFDFQSPAEVYSVEGRRGRRNPVVFRRFATCAEALRYAIEGLNAEVLRSAVVETCDARYGAEEIRSLYNRPDYPLSRGKLC